MSLLCSSWQKKGFRKMHAWGTRTQPLTPFSPWHKPYNTEERPLVWQRSLQQSSSLQRLGALRAKAGDRLTPRDSRSFSFSPNRKHMYPGATVQGETHTHTHTHAHADSHSHLRNPTQTAGSSGYLSLVCYLPTRHLTCPKALPNRICVQASSAQTLPLPLCQADHEGTVRKAPAGTAAAGSGEG